MKLGLARRQTEHRRIEVWKFLDSKMHRDADTEDSALM